MAFELIGRLESEDTAVERQLGLERLPDRLAPPEAVLLPSNAR